MLELTPKQQLILDFIENKLADNAPPSQKGIAEHFGLAQNAIYQVITYLKQKGYLNNSSIHRGLRLSRQYLEHKQQTKGIPVIGKVAAGTPILAQQNIAEYIDFQTIITKHSKDAFILQVVGESMIDDGIMHGDYVIVNPQPTVKNNEIAVVLLNDEATVKRVSVQKDLLALKPANKKFKIRYVKPADKDIRIIGKVIGCFRNI